MSVDLFGKRRNRSSLPRPQMSDSEITELAAFSDRFDTLVEFGAGASTVLWSRHFSHVISVESRFSWFHTVQQWLVSEGATNVQLVFAPPRIIGVRHIRTRNLEFPSALGLRQSDGVHRVLSTRVRTNRRPSRFPGLCGWPPPKRSCSVRTRQEPGQASLAARCHTGTGVSQ